ncbi:MAG: tRNA 4-thiouridine(8) synthase ThiI [Methanoregulaceae archaeon]|nr:tRNA 4-thiouridine(8) synthase ThiI [Methanoregulaceae archaeon]MDD5049101.1 tRNA 4-thiouridine(8) synthase ThiI [Methanoregulaceae archaeon]
MTNTIWLVRYGELALKSPPVRRRWENVICDRIRESFPGCRTRKEPGRIWIEGEADPDVLSRIFGIVSFSECTKTTLDLLRGDAADYCASRGFSGVETFAVRVHRQGNHPFTSKDLEAELGRLIGDTFPHLKVDLRHPEKVLFVEIRSHDCYLFDEVHAGAGGLPPGVSGSVVALFSGGIDSPVAAWMMMKRGCRIIPVYMAIEGYLDDDARRRAVAGVEALRTYQPDIRLVTIKDSYLSEAKKELASRRLDKYTCILCKRRMYRIAGEIASGCGANGIVTGESLGQVASQTLDNLAILTEAAVLPVYRPLIGLDKTEITEIARTIGTYEPSIMKTGGCGAVPVKPATTGKPGLIREIENSIIPVDYEVDGGGRSGTG